MRADETRKPEGPEGVDGDVPIEWGSDALAELLSRLDLRYLALVPGSSYRGLHDSLVNYTGNRDPRMLVCLHEEHAVAIAHGYAKVTGRPMAVALHSNVGLMHATMAIYNAWCDRVPMLIVGATGPVDAARRRPWIDWIHTSADQGALIRPYVKWDDQPASVEAALDSLAQAYSITRAAPSAPVYVCLDVSLQEQRLPAPPAIPDVRRDRSPRSHGPDAEAVRTTLDFLGQARRPLFLFGRGQPRRAGLGSPRRPGRTVRRAGALRPQERRGLPDRAPAAPEPARHLPARRVRRTDRGRGPDPEPGLDRPGRDPGRRGQPRPSRPPARIISCTSDSALRNGWSKDSFGREPVDLSVPADPDLLVRALLEPGEPGQASRMAGHGRRPGAAAPATAPATASSCTTWPQRSATRSQAHPPAWSGSRSAGTAPTSRPATRWTSWGWTAARASAPGRAWPSAPPSRWRAPAALPVAVLGDGDFLMGGTALWTAAHYRLPLLIVVANNSSFHNDVVHAERMAGQRRRPARNTWIGQAISDPDPDLPAFARSLGFHAAGQVRDRSALPAALAAAVAAARSGQCALVDVRIRPDD